VNSFTVSDANTNRTETVTVQASLTVSDAATVLFEIVSLTASVTVSETRTGTDAITVAAYFTITQTGLGVDVWTASMSIPVSDYGTGADLVTDRGIGISELVVGAEFAWRLKGFVMLDSLELPHVQRIRIIDDAEVSEKKIQGGSLPLRQLTGKPGRVVEIEGWTKSQTDIDNLETLVDGVPRSFIHPSGDSFAVLVTRFNPDRRADAYGRATYRLTLVELRSW